MPTGTNITAEQQQMIAEAYQGGLTKQGVATQFGVSLPTVYKALTALGVANHPSSRVRPERRAEIVRLYQGGMSRIGVADVLRASPDTVREVLISEGCDLRPQFVRKIGEDRMASIAASYRNGAAIADLAGDLGVTLMTVHKVLRRQGVSLRDDRGRRREYTGAEIATIRQMAGQGRSQAAIAVALNSAQGTISKLMRQHGMAPAMTGHASRERHGHWIGGRTKHPSGYWQVRLASDDPFYSMVNRTGCVMEHRLVMARKLGRPLALWESVHHINGDRTDNGEDNLQLRTGQHGSHVVLRCRTCGSNDIESTRIAEA